MSKQENKKEETIEKVETDELENVAGGSAATVVSVAQIIKSSYTNCLGPAPIPTKPVITAIT